MSHQEYQWFPETLKYCQWQYTLMPFCNWQQHCSPKPANHQVSFVQPATVVSFQQLKQSSKLSRQNFFSKIDRDLDTYPSSKVHIFYIECYIRQNKTKEMQQNVQTTIWHLNSYDMPHLKLSFWPDNKIFVDNPLVPKRQVILDPRLPHLNPIIYSCFFTCWWWPKIHLNKTKKQGKAQY